MAKFVWKNPQITVNGQDISNYVHEVSVETSRADVDVTGFQAANTEHLAGLGDAQITMTVYQDFGAAAIDALLWPLSTSNTPFTVAVRAAVGAKSATNPEYSMQALLLNYNPISGAVGDAADTPVTFVNAAQAGLTRAIV
jgi:hypothetical protein